jgi:hypothetical protein
LKNVLLQEQAIELKKQNTLLVPKQQEGHYLNIRVKLEIMVASL